MFQGFVKSLITTTIPLLGVYILQKQDREYEKLLDEKQDLLWGKSSLSIARAGGIIAEDNKNKEVAGSGEVDISRQVFLNVFRRLENIVGSVPLNEVERERIREYYGLMECHTVKSFKREQEQYSKKELEGYEEKFFSQFSKLKHLLNK